ncbi:hypothetical protein BD413DRAFT_36191 [Trametes elegans]|nr:hypothetical protein BD413DRAFT_36191 [Trametes elegans]
MSLPGNESARLGVSMASEWRTVWCSRLSLPPIRSTSWPGILPGKMLLMENAVIPNDACELINDCSFDHDRPRSEALRQHKAIFRSYALVCSDWLPCSRCNLYRRVILDHASTVDPFVRTISNHPQYAALVHELYVDPIDEHPSELLFVKRYIPFAQTPIPQLTTNLHKLSLRRLDWGRYLHHYLTAAGDRPAGTATQFHISK